MTFDELQKAKTTLESLHRKLKKTIISLEEKANERYKSQITLASNRVSAIELSIHLIEKEIQNFKIV